MKDLEKMTVEELEQEMRKAALNITQAPWRPVDFCNHRDTKPILDELIRRAKLAENKSDVIKELKNLNVRFLDRHCEDLPYKENCDEEIFSANDFFYFINERIAILKGAKDGK